MAKNDLVVAISGASGAPYGVRLLQVLLAAGHSVHLTISPSAIEVMRTEMGQQIGPELRLDNFQPQALLGDCDTSKLYYHHFRDFRAGIASGSFLTGGMAVCPCSMGTVSAIAHGTSSNLIHRAADVHLKEHRKLILVPRETPLGIVQLKNLLACAEAGAVILPAMPAFYTRPKRLEDMIDFVVARVCDQLGVEHRLLKRWSE
jgi:4-hydroxy-3-polyprenylbenzoate decarboxylase